MTEFCASLDRGFYSAANVRELVAHGIDFVMGVPFSVTRARELVRKYRSALSSTKRSFPFHGRVMRHVRDDWVVPAADGSSRTLDVHVYFEAERQAERVARLERAVFALEEKAAKETFRSRTDAFAWTTENAGVLAKCLCIRGDAGHPDGVHVVRKPRAVARATAHMGYTVVLAARRDAPAAEVLADYRGRDRVEKLFDSLKNEDGQYRLRTGVDAAAEGRLMVAFAALVLRSALEEAMRSGDLLRKMTTADFLAQMRKIKAVTTRTGKRILLEVTRTQRRLLASVKVPLPQ
jgi:transposase